MESRIQVKLHYYEPGDCKAVYKIKSGKNKGIPICAIDVMDEPTKDTDISKLNWHTLSDPNGFAEPCAPIGKEFIAKLTLEKVDE